MVFTTACKCPARGSLCFNGQHWLSFTFAMVYLDLMLSSLQLTLNELWVNLVRLAVCRILGWRNTEKLKSSVLEGLFKAAFCLMVSVRDIGSNYFSSLLVADVTQVHFQWCNTPWKKIKSPFLDMNCAQVNGWQSSFFFYSLQQLGIFRLRQVCQQTRWVKAKLTTSENPFSWSQRSSGEWRFRLIDWKKKFFLHLFYRIQV